ncbi:hypothetical protein CWI38_0675p0020 [Hamiltosporidium tvaerminnensis]|uniref:Uncharacterized protein n=1 Tax=Hamiltosporidium tvaerminnensis TaxID=1176355 RepID=A0A4Q9LY52_9MICR|nr:hypothetical protein CWI38_0675p0020 [Hamiltosporidium tvaerminnensis]
MTNINITDITEVNLLVLHTVLTMSQPKIKSEEDRERQGIVLSCIGFVLVKSKKKFEDENRKSSDPNTKTDERKITEIVLFKGIIEKPMDEKALLLRLESADFSKLGNTFREVLIKHKSASILRIEHRRNLHNLLDCAGENKELYARRSIRPKMGNSNKIHLAQIKGFLKPKYKSEEKPRRKVWEAQPIEIYSEIENTKAPLKVILSRKNELLFEPSNKPMFCYDDIYHSNKR